MKQIYLTHLVPVLSLVIYLVNYNKRIFRAVTYTILFMLSNISYSQSQVSISGKVIDESTGQALPGTTVIIEGTTIGTIADYDGNFTIKDVPTGTYNLIANFVSYKKMTQEVTVELGLNYDYTVIADFALFYDQLMMDQVVVTGIASKNSRATSAVAVQRIDAEKFTELSNYNSVGQLVTGKIAGVSLQSTGGGFGAATRFTVRSGGGINGNGQPAIFVDGVRMSNSLWSGAGQGEGGGISSLVGLNPENIANIEVIKGPAGAASYGTGAANGVILITTKRGTNKGWEANFRSTIGFNDMRDIKELEFRNHQYLEDNFFQRGAIFKNRFSASGGSDQIKAFFSVDKNNEKGHVANNSFDQTNVRLNMDFTPSNKLSVKSSAQYGQTEIVFPQRGRGDGEFGYLSFVRVPYNEEFDGPFNASYYDGRSEDLNMSHNFTGSIATLYSPFADSDNALSALTTGLTVGLNNVQNTNFFVQKRTTEAVEGSDEPGERRIGTFDTRNITLTSDISYGYNMGRFSGTSSIGTQLFNDRSEEVINSRSNFASNLVSTLNGAQLAGTSNESFNHYRSAGIFTSHSFSFDDKYLASVMIRQDYASVLGSLSSSIIYPAANFAIRLDKFDFLPSSISLLKTRIAYGESGTLPGRIDGIPILWSLNESQYGIGSNLSSFGNPSLEPERVKQLELGIDAQFGNYGLELTYYKEDVVNSIVPKANVTSSGQNASSPLANIGKVEGSGLETQFFANFAGEALGGWRADFTLNNSWQQNEVTDMGGAGGVRAGAGGGRQWYREGLPKGAYYNQVSVGALFSDGTNEQEFETAPNYGEVLPSGVAYGAESSDGDVYIGTNDPRYVGSLTTSISAGGFTLFTFFEWKTGLVIYNEQDIDQQFYGLDTDWFGGVGSNSLYFDELSTKLGFGNFTDDAKLTPGTQEYKDAADQFAASSFFADANAIQPGDFLKFRELSLSYNFKNIRNTSDIIKNLRLGVVGTNLFQWYRRKPQMRAVETESGEKVNRWMGGYTGLDPEATAFGFSNGPANGIQSATLPVGRSFSMFVSITF